MTVQEFLPDAIPEADLEKIVKAGMNAQSAMNGQPWHFSVVTNKEVLSSIAEKMKSVGPKAAVGDSPVAIIISGKNGSDYDAGLATQLMTVEAVLLGYGTKIISSPTIVLYGPEKESFKEILGIPANMSVKGVILIGKYDQKKVDAVASATVRKDSSEVVTFVK